MPSLWLLITGFGGGIIGSPLALWIALRFGILNAPNPIVPQHTRPVAYLGGIGILFGIAVACALGSQAFGAKLLPEEYDLLLPAALFGLFGAFDDVRPLQPGPKLLGQILIAGIAVAAGTLAPFTGIPLLDIGVNIFWIVLMVNAVNFTDVCNGLVTGLAGAFFLIWSIANPESGFALACLGACLGFLPFNFPAARMFLGDAGSHLLGFLMAALLLEGWGGAVAGMTEMLLFAVVPLYELAFITAVRIRKGLPWWRGSPDHFALRLQAAGWSRVRVDVSAWSLMAGGGLLAITLPTLDKGPRVSLIMALIALGVAIARYLLRHEVRPATVPVHAHADQPLPDSATQ